MPRTRRFKSLINMGTKNVKIVEKIAVYDDNGNQIDCAVIHVDDDGREYYYPSNPNDKFGLFTHRIKDAIECIRNDFGDVLQRRSVYDGMVFENVIRYIDREHGEQLREQMLEGWKDAEFEYAISIISNSICNTNVLSKDDTVSGMVFMGLKNIKTFETESAAKSYIEKLQIKSKEYFEEYNNIIKQGGGDVNVKIFVNNIEGFKDHGCNSIYFRLFDIMNDNNGDCSNIMKIIQIVKH